MKAVITILIASTSLCGCATTSSTLPSNLSSQSSLQNYGEYHPPFDFEASRDFDRQMSEMESVQQEEQAYRASVEHIQQKFQDERLQLQMCAEVYGEKSKECFQMILDLCKIDTYLDTRGNHHIKEYCAKSFLDYHNPNKKY